MKIYVVYESHGISMFLNTVKVFKLEQDAVDYCTMQNQINKPELDDYGPVEGVYHGYYAMELE